MILKCTLLSVALVIGFAACRSDLKRDFTEHEIDSIMLDFSVQWKNDSLGRTGFRMDHHSSDTVAKTRLINGVNLRGYSESHILKWLGRPGDSFRHFEGNGLVMVYAIEPDGTGWGSKSLVIYFDENDKVSAVVQRN
ncbi:MAG TPA: hypothetical protein VFE50_08770 [Cyclobacteriaceae bacterium]|nr:hypothetical protein [Cyclobacteriaceae bacterium]